MMNHLDKTIAIILFFASIQMGWSQINPDTLSIEPSVQQDSIMPFYSDMFAIGRYSGDSIVLRWSPAQAGGWHVGNKIGYWIERTVLNSDSTYNPETFAPIISNPIKPWPLDDWQKIAGDGKDKYAAIAAQAIYGEGFNSGGFLEQADEFKNRFSFALLAADFSAQTANALGLRYVDKDIENNKSYVYRIFLAETTENYTVDTAYQIIHTSHVEPLPDIKITSLHEGENVISFTWDRILYENYYSAYYIERSLDNRNFTRLNDDPFINALSDDFRTNQDKIIFSDSIPENYKTYYYRIIGITPFGELSQPQTTIKAMGRDRTPPEPPINLTTETISGKVVRLNWQKEVIESDLKGFIVSRAQEINGSFVPLFVEPLPIQTTSFTDENAVEFGTNYYKVSAIDTAGNISSSLISYAMMIDSIPPDQPRGLSGSIDSTGVVQLSWNLGKEENLKGYNIYFSNSKDHVFTTLNNHPIQDTVFTDSIQIKTLTEEIYYFIKALDVNHSLSSSSDTIMLKRPDLIAPTSPVITDYYVSKKGITIKWQNSTSRDAVKTFLYRKQEGQDYVKVANFNVTNGATAYRDTLVSANRLYVYALKTQDDDSLYSEFSLPVKIKMGFKDDPEKIENLMVIKSEEEDHLTLSWTNSAENVDYYIIYRAVDGRNFKTYSTVKSEYNTFKDHYLKSGSKYEYTVVIQFKDGRTSGFGKIVAHVN